MPVPGYRVPPPADSDLVSWPAHFGTRFTVFVDTEEEFDWNAPLARTGYSTTSIRALPESHRRFVDHGVPLTYMVDFPVVDDPRAVDILRALLTDGVSAVGTQLHAWVNPPFTETVTPANSYAGNLGHPLEAAKLDVLTDAITAAFGAPLVYRAGRYGVGPGTLRLLAERGYRIDSSMRARYDYGADGGPDFRAIGNRAFRRDGVVALPLTTVFTGTAARFGSRLFSTLGRVPKGRGVFARAGLLSRVALTPEDMPLADAREAVAVALGEGVRVLNFSFHSPSLEPGHTPYVRDAADLVRFHVWWDTILGDLARRGVRAASLAELITASEALPPPRDVR